jgi:glycosyltransferase involved in cell wall biosynthesis
MKTPPMRDILLITWHGIHELEIFPGLPDTGGQNIYVENMAQQIHDLYQCRVIVLNRGGFTHPYTQRMREGYSKDPDRELYVLHIHDEVEAFLRKEFLTPALLKKAANIVPGQLFDGYHPDMIISHFWDGGMLGLYLSEVYPDTPHLWVPHEPVGMKQAPLPVAQYDDHSIHIRQRCEERIMAAAQLVGSTSKLVRDDLETYYEGTYNHKIIDIFPGVNTNRFCPLESDCMPGSAIKYHAEFLDLPEELLRKPHICEFGRSDSLKDKDKAVEAFVRVAREIDDLVLFMNLDEKMEPEIAARIHDIVAKEDLEDRVIILSPEQLPQTGHGSDIMPNLLQTAKVFITMSIMEGFGMAACEAAACGVPVVGTEHIPVVTDVIAPAGGGRVVPGKDVEAAAKNMIEILRMDEKAYSQTCLNAYQSVIPKYRWDTIVQEMFDQVHEKGVKIDLS